MSPRSRDIPLPEEEQRPAGRSRCRLSAGQVWEDPKAGHRVGALDASRPEDFLRIMGGEKAALVMADPPYNVRLAGQHRKHFPRSALPDYLRFSERWVRAAAGVMAENAHFYVWLGADHREEFQPLADFILMMRGIDELASKNWITVRNQRGYGTQKNWMWVRQELLHYVRGKPPFRPVYTEIPKVLKGYYKVVGGRRQENLERSRSPNIRPGNVWIDIQQVFHLMEENVPGCYAQKPLAAIDRILLTSSAPGDLVLDPFSHSGTTLISGERSGRKVYTFDIDPLFAEITIRRLERYRATGKTGWQREDPWDRRD